MDDEKWQSEESQHRSREERNKNRHKKKRLKRIKFFCGIFFVLFFIVLGVWLFIRFMPNNEHIAIRDAISEWKGQDKVLILDDVPIALSNPPIIQDEEIYLPLAFINEYIDDDVIFEGDTLTILTADKTLKIREGKHTLEYEGGSLAFESPLIKENDTVYVPEDILETLYDVTIGYSNDTGIVNVDKEDTDVFVGYVQAKKPVLRTEASIKAYILEDLRDGEVLRVYEKLDKWLKVRTQSGLVGYIRTKDIGKIDQTAYSASQNKVTMEQLYDVWGDGIDVLVRDVPVETTKYTVLLNGEIYLNSEFVKEYIDKYIFWEADISRLTVTFLDKVIRLKPNQTQASVNNETVELHTSIIEKDGMAYIPQSLLEGLYYVSMEYVSLNNVVILDYTDEAKTQANITSKEAVVRADKGVIYDIVDKISFYEQLTIFEQEDEWTKVRTSKGNVGYVKSSAVFNINKTEGLYKEQANLTSWKPSSGKINLVWDQLFKVADAESSTKLKSQQGLDVLSPTWLSIKDAKGNIRNIISKKYVSWAHSNGYQVWALLDNQFDGVLTHEVLTNGETREYIINQLVSLAINYDLDGINIDFESIKKETSDFYLQFIRELAPFLRKEGKVISVDTYIPSSWSWYYRRDEIADVVDYVMVMTYDEHWSTSPESGSVASIGWVREAVKASLELIPKEKLIMGIPYYTRLWAETSTENGITLSSTAYAMQTALNILKENNIEPVWNEESGQYYAEYTRDNVVYKIWLEEDRSIEERLKILTEYDLAGAAAWKRGLEKDGIQELMYSFLKK